MPVQNLISRRFERECDRYAIERTNDPEAFISTMDKLAEQNLSDRTPCRLVELLFYSHPPISKRIEMAIKILITSGFVVIGLVTLHKKKLLRELPKFVLSILTMGIILAVANSIAAVQAGCVQVHGTINGYGERCGNANLISIIGNLKLKLGIDTVSDIAMKGLTELAHYVAEISNMRLSDNQPFVLIRAL